MRVASVVFGLPARLPVGRAASRVGDTTRANRLRAVPSGVGAGRRLTVIDKCDQATKGVRWMSWHREATKDVGACDKPREAGNQALIRGCPNRETGRDDLPSLPAECIGRVERTQGTETSKYLEEQKKTLIPSVAASERGTAQTGLRSGVEGTSS